MLPAARVLTAAVALAATGCIAAPAMASGRPSVRPTHLTIHAAKGHVAPKRQDVLTIHLSSGHKGIEGEQANITLLERSVSASGHKSHWVDVTTQGTVTDAGNGAYVITGVVPNDPHVKHGHKDQFRVRFAGDASYRASHSSVITVVVKPAKSAKASEPTEPTEPSEPTESAS